MFQDKALLGRLFGWKVAKEAKTELPFAQWLNYKQEEDQASATLLLREKKYTCQLKKLSPTLVEGRCSCPFHRREGLLCAHLGLLFLAICDPKERRLASTSDQLCAPLPKIAEKESLPSKESALWPNAPSYRISVPDNLALLATKAQIPFQMEVLETKDTKKEAQNRETRENPESLLTLAEESSLADQKLAQWLTSLGHSPQTPPSLLFLKEGEILSSFWQALTEHPRLFWKKSPFNCTEELPLRDCQLLVSSSEKKNTEERIYTLSLNTPFSALLPWKDGFLNEKEAIFYPKIAFLEAPCCLNRSERLAFLQGRPLCLSLEELASVAPLLLSSFICPALKELPELEIEEPALTLEWHWKGSPKKLVLEAFASYGDTYGSFPLFPQKNTALSPQFHPKKRRLWQPQEAQQNAVIKQLESWGFHFSPQGWTLLSQEKTAPFWFFIRPQQKEGSLSLLAGPALPLSQHISPELKKAWASFVPLRPQLDFLSSFAQGQDWLEAEFSFQSPAGESLPPQEVLSLLRSGKKSFSLKKGQTALLDTETTEDWLALLSESNLTQLRPNHYKLSSQSALSLSAFSPSPPPFLEKKSLKIPSWTEQEATLAQHCLYTLRPYQKEGVRWLYERLLSSQGALLADDMGLGKTLQTLALFVLLKESHPLLRERPSLLVVPTSLLFNWQEEIQKAFPSLTLDVLYGQGREEVQIRELGLTTYGLLARDLARHKRTPYALVAFDEASLVKNPKTDIAQALQGLHAEYKLALTGTPLENSVSDLWSIFRITLPTLLGSQAAFQKHYQTPIQKDPRSPEATQALRRLKLKVQPWILRRTKKEVAPELPPKTTLIHSLELSPEDKALYGQLLKQGQELIHTTRQKQGKEAAHFALLTTLLRLRQLCDDARLLPLKDKQRPSSYRGQKMEALLLLIEDLLANKHKVLIFSQFTSMLHLVSKELSLLGARHLLLEGATPHRGQLLCEFQKEDGPSLFLISLKAGGYGLNLQNADTVIHLDPWWNPAVEAQATDRAYRLGQRHPVHVYKMMIKNSVEEKILALQEQKKHLLDSMLTPSSLASFTSLSEDELSSLL